MDMYHEPGALFANMDQLSSHTSPGLWLYLILLEYMLSKGAPGKIQGNISVS